MTKAFVSILMGSDSDLPLLENTMSILKGFGIPFEAKVASAHRTPDVVSEYVTDAEKRGCAVFIGAAGLAAHLAGAIAARTTRPVIGIPCDGGPLSGVDALYSTVQMPGGIPVATVAINGSKNAAYLALQIIAINNKDVREKLLKDRLENAEKVLEANEEVITKY